MKKCINFTMRVLLFLLIVILYFDLTTNISSAAENKGSEFSVQDLTFKINKTASSKQVGEVCIIKANNKSSIINIVIPEQVKYNGKSYKIIEIGLKAFKGLKVESIILPKTIKTIGWYAFQNCINLDKISIPEATKTIGTGCFRGCTKLEKVTLPEKLKKLSTSVFYGCKQLRTINTSDLTEIGAYAFYGCINLDSINLKNASTIYNNAFNNCSSLKKIDLSSLVSNRIEKNLFKGCTDLVEVKLSDNVEIIEDAGFADLQNLQIINLEKIKSIGSDAFNNCISLKGINLNNTTYIGSSAFSNCVKLNEVNLSNTMTIGTCAFENCNSLQEVYLNDYVNIGESAFKGCENMLIAIKSDSYIIDYLERNNIKYKITNIPKLEIQKIEDYFADKVLYLKLTNKSTKIYSNINGTYTLLDTIGDEVGGGYVNLSYIVLKSGESYILQIPINKKNEYSDFKLDLTCSYEITTTEDLSEFLEFSFAEETIIDNFNSKYTVHFESTSPKKINDAKIQIVFYNNDKIVSICEINKNEIYKGSQNSTELFPCSHIYTSYIINISSYQKN